MDSPLALKSFLKRHKITLPIVVGGQNLKRLGADVRRATVLVARVLRRRRVIAGYLSTHRVSKLQIGVGFNVLEGWLNVDRDPEVPGVVYMDAAGRFPLPDRCLEYIFSEHLVEHLPHADGLHMLRESFRALKPGGKIRLVTSDWNFI